MKKNLNSLVEEFSKLDLVSKEHLLKIFQLQIKKIKRNLLLKTIRQAENNFKSGKFKKGSINDLMKDLND